MSTPIVPTPDSSDNLKRCTKCGELKPRDAFHRLAESADGLKSQCKVCRNANERETRANNRDELNRRSREWKQNNKDKISKSGRNYRETHREELKAKKKTYYEENKEVLNVRSSVRRQKNKEAIREQKRKYAQEHRDHLREYRRKYHQLHRDEQRAKAVLRQATPIGKAAVVADRHRRRARERRFPASFTPQDWLVAVAYFDGCCAVCGRPPGLWHKLSADHWIPLTSPDCPGTVPWNIVPLCHGVDGCNNQKNDRNADEWLVAKFGKRKGRAIQKRIEDYLVSRKPALTELA